MEIVDEDPARRWISPGDQFCEKISDIVVLSGDVMQLDPLEFVLELAHLWNPENTFLGIQSNVEPSEVHEHGGQVCNHVASLSRFDHYVINIDNDCWFRPLGLIRLIERVDLVGEALLHSPLVGGASVL